MSESNGHHVERLSPGEVTFDLPDGVRLTVPALDTVFELQALAEGLTVRAYLDRVRAWIKDRCGAEVSYEVADQLSDRLAEIVEQKKSDRLARIRSASTSPSSTPGSTPSP